MLKFASKKIIAETFTLSIKHQFMFLFKIVLLQDCECKFSKMLESCLKYTSDLKTPRAVC